ncbi:MAG TPA: DNA translocase FtsK 4TM domain-containing protein [Candidatus Limnocylindrales bacterium]|nr:DNA translocase FtsK 4TM domain-containing protein [Candidatus Limnocylindrales bacterium]
MAQRRRTASSPARSRPTRTTRAAARPRTPSSRSRRSGQAFRIAPGTARSLVGIVLLVVGAVTLIALILPAGGLLNRYVAEWLQPAFGQGAWLLPILLLVAGAFVERAPSVGSGWGVTAIGGLVTFLGGLGIIHLVSGHGTTPAALEAGGGWLGSTLSSALSTLVSPPGAFVVLLGLVVAGILLLFNLTVRGLLSPVVAGGRALAGVMAVGPEEEAGEGVDPRMAGAAGAAGALGAVPEAGARGSREKAGPGARAARTTPGAELDADAGAPVLPAPMPSPAPVSQTVWSGGRSGGPALPPGAQAGQGVLAQGLGAAMASHAGPATGDDLLLEAEDAPQPLHERTWALPPLDLLDPPRSRTAGNHLDHERNIRIIEEKLHSFQIPATVSGTNVGPVVTQYEVRPDARVKLSRIEGLADDLAMALAARSIRIEAPIPGKDVVGIEIPNHSSEIVGFRQLIDESDMLSATSKLTFALGRDVSGKPYAVDLAKMPHLLIAGATGSGKSVCVNALITSLLMRATPAEVRLILIDLKRVELAPYDGLPHLLTNVIVEAADAKAALHWAVAQMEERYKALAARSERNIAAYNASPKVPPEERLPYLVIVIDELADLIMREGRKVEDPVVKVAQKARAVGIHLVLATQRPSVNVVTGLIKANVPSRVAFAMSSNVDSRTVLDQPGAEDLIGRGDMLYQPADLPKPVRLQGVFVSDAEVRAVTDRWRSQAPEPDYDPEVVSYADAEGGGGSEFGWLSRAAGDEMAARAAELVTTSGKASTSMLQTKLKVGFNRASRLMDELERYGIVGPQDPRNPAVPRAVYGRENWLHGPEDVDDPGL